MPLSAQPDWMPDDHSLRVQLAGGSFASPRYRLQLATSVCRLLPEDGACAILDIGCGEGRLASLIKRERPETMAIGAETFIRPSRQRHMEIVRFDGTTLPFGDKAVDVALLLNVLHHADDPRCLLKEACRVARRRVVIKDHIANSWWQRQQLTMLDVLGNAGTGAVVRARYLSEQDWWRLFEVCPDARVERVEELAFRRGILKVLFPNSLEVIFSLE